MFGIFDALGDNKITDLVFMSQKILFQVNLSLSFDQMTIYISSNR